MKKYTVHIVWAIVAVVALVGGIFWGKAMVPARGAGAFAGRGAASGTFAGRGGAGGGFVAGTVTAIDSDSITLQLANGNSENVFYSSSTQVIEPQAASISSVQPGTMVMVGGSTDSSGNLTATSIQIRNAANSGATGAPGTGPGAGQATGSY
jgi:hypothetical protein